MFNVRIIVLNPLSPSMKMLLKEPGGLGYVDRNTYQNSTSGNDGDNNAGLEVETSNSRNHDKHLKRTWWTSFSND